MELVRITLVFLLCFIIDRDGGVQSVKGFTGCPDIDLPNGRTRLRARGRMVNFRCKRGFQRVGARFAVCLSSKQWSQPAPTCVGTNCPKLTPPPDMMIEEEYKGGVLKFSCKTGLTRKGPETIVCDGKNWSDQPPKCLVGMSMGCDFELEGLCGWSQDANDNFDWTWHTGQTPTAKTGPQFDHTTNTPEGHYIFMESSAPQKPGHVARLLSPPYEPDIMVNVCLEFFYHMFGSRVGQLEVFAKPLKEPTSMVSLAPKIFGRKGNYGDEWVRADEIIPPQKETFQIVFQGTRAAGWTSDIAIDDIRLYNCSERPPTTTIAPVLGGGDENTDDNNVDRDTPTKTKSTATTTTPTTTVRRTTKRRTTKRTTTTTTTTAPPTTTSTTGTTRTTTTTKPSPSSTTTKSTSTTTTPTPTTTTTSTTKETTAKTKISSPSPSTTTDPDQSYSPQDGGSSSQRTVTGANVDTTGDIDKTMLPPTYTTTFIDSPDDYDKNDDDDDYDDDDDDLEGGDYDDGTDGMPSTTVSDVTDYDDTNMFGRSASPLPDQAVDRNDTNTPFVDFDHGMDVSDVTSSVTDVDEEGDRSDGNGIGVGKVKENSGDSSTDTMGLLPLIIGVVAAVMVVAVVISVLAWMWAKNQRRKQAKEQEDQMNIITEYVETNLSI